MNSQSIHIIKQGSSQDVVIIFSARAVEKGKFTFWKLANRLPCNAILVNDYSSGWYLKGTPEFVDEQAFLVDLEHKIAYLKGKQGRLFTMGSSMGAYAALKYGAFLGADRILALGPESELCIPLGRSVASLPGLAEGAGDISRLTYKDPSNVLVISGNNDIVDFYCACKIKDGNPDIDVALINNETHVVAKYIEAKVGLYEAISEFLIRGGKTFLSTLDRAQLANVQSAFAIKKFNQELATKVSVDYADEIKELARANPSWSMVQYFYALLLQSKNDANAAVDALNKALAVHPNLGRARLKRAQLKCNLRDYPDAINDLLILANSNLTFSVVDLLHKAYAAIGKNGLAIDILEQAMSLQLTPTQEALVKKKIIATASALSSEHQII